MTLKKIANNLLCIFQIIIIMISVFKNYHDNRMQYFFQQYKKHVTMYDRGGGVHSDPVTYCFHVLIL